MRYASFQYGTAARYAEGVFGAVIICGATVSVCDRAWTQIIGGDCVAITLTIRDRRLQAC